MLDTSRKLKVLLPRIGITKKDRSRYVQIYIFREFLRRIKVSQFFRQEKRLLERRVKRSVYVRFTCGNFNMDMYIATASRLA